MPKMIDLAEVEAAMEEFRISQRKKAEDPTMGFVYRAQLAVTPELTLWRAREINRGTDGNEIMNAIVMLIAATIGGEVMAETDDQADQFDIVNKILRAVAEETAAILTKPGYIVNQRFDLKEAGRA